MAISNKNSRNFRTLAYKKVRFIVIYSHIASALRIAELNKTSGNFIVNYDSIFSELMEALYGNK